MFKKLLTGFFVIGFALMSVPVTSFAAVEVGDNLTLSGDFRFRYDFDTRSGTGIPSTADNREVPQLRARFGANYQSAIDWLSFGLRISTNDSDLQNPNQTFSAVMANGFNLDRAFLVAKFLETGAVIVGKQAYPLWQQTEVMWDEDIQPEGFAIAYQADLAGAGNLTAAVAHFYLNNNAYQGGLFDNDTLEAWQVHWTGQFNQVKPTLAFTGQHILRESTAGVCASGTLGGLAPGVPTGSAATGCQETDFYMVSGQLQGAVNDVKLLVGLDYHFSSWNEPTGDDNDNGIVGQIRANLDKYGVRYYYYWVEEAAAPFYGNVSLSQNNFNSSGGGAGVTGFQGHRIQFDYAAAENVSADFRIYLLDGESDNIFALATTPTHDYNRYQLNINLKF